MLISKTVKLSFPFNSTDFFVVEEVIRDTEEEHISQRSLFIADEKVPGGMTLIKKGDPYYSTRGGQFVWPPQRFYGDVPSAANPVENP